MIVKLGPGGAPRVGVRGLKWPTIFFTTIEKTVATNLDAGLPGDIHILFKMTFAHTI